MEDGFIPLGRSFFAHYLWEEERVYSRAEAWLDLVQQGAYRAHKKMVAGVLVEVKRGRIAASERFLSDRWKWSRTKVRAFLDLLKSDNMISVQKDHETTMITLCNYETYNNGTTAKKPEKDQRKTTEEPPKDQREEGKEGEQRKHTGSARGADAEVPERKQALAQAANQGIPGDFAGYVFDDWFTRDGKDGGGVVVSFPGYLKKRWNREGPQWISGAHKGKANANGTTPCGGRPRAPDPDTTPLAVDPELYLRFVTSPDFPEYAHLRNQPIPATEKTMFPSLKANWKEFKARHKP